MVIFCCFLLAHFAQTDLCETNAKKDPSVPIDESAQKENLLELAIKWNCFSQATDLLADLPYINVSISHLLKRNVVIFVLETSSLGQIIRPSA